MYLLTALHTQEDWYSNIIFLLYTFYCTLLPCHFFPKPHSSLAFVPPQDSVAAMEALVEYSYRARLRDVTDMRVIIEQSADPNFTVDVHINNNLGLAELRSFDVRHSGVKRHKEEIGGVVVLY